MWVYLRDGSAQTHWDRSCRSNFPSHPVTVYWHWANQSQHWPYDARRLALKQRNTLVLEKVITSQRCCVYPMVDTFPLWFRWWAPCFPVYLWNDDVLSWCHLRVEPSCRGEDCVGRCFAVKFCDSEDVIVSNRHLWIEIHTRQLRECRHPRAFYVQRYLCTYS